VSGLTRRRLLTAGIGTAVVAAAGAAGLELIEHGVLPGKTDLAQLDGACEVAGPPLVFGRLGQSRSGRFYSRARRQQVGYTITWPPGHGPGSRLPLVVLLHGEGRDHTDVLSGMTQPQAPALRINGRRLPPMAMVAADGGTGYWNPHPGDNAMGMVIDELIPFCQRLGLGRPPHRIGTMGISMGGYGALLFAEKYPRLISAVVAIGPAVWTSYQQARAVNQAAYASAADFAANDVVTHARALAGKPVRVASGLDDPFQPGVAALARVLPTGHATVIMSAGCHTGPFFTQQEPPSLAFLGRHLS
jgi:pimeloyl-ACP methyl ester carboxylesterase